MPAWYSLRMGNKKSNSLPTGDGLITSWGRTVIEVLDAAAITQQELTAALGYEHRNYVNRLVNGKRKPSPDTVKRINRAIAKLTGHPQLWIALDGEALRCGLLDASRDPDVANHSMNLDSMSLDSIVREVLFAFSRYKLLFREEFRDRIAAYMRGLGAAGARKFAIELNHAFHRMMLAELRPAPAPVGFVSICETLERHGFDVTALLTVDGAEMRAWDRALWVVQRELYLSNPSASARERLASEKRIFDVFREHFEVRRAPRAATEPIVAATKPRRKMKGQS